MNFSRSSLLLATSLLGLSASRHPAAAFLSSSHQKCNASRHLPRHQRQELAKAKQDHSSSTIVLLMAARYGPQDAQLPQENNTDNTSNGSTNDNDDDNRSKLKRDFTSLLTTIINDDLEPTDYPSLFTQNIEMILSVLSSESSSSSEGNASLSLLEEIIRDVVRDLDDQSSIEEGDEDEKSSNRRLDEVSEAVNLILSFVETFVEETTSLNDVYKQLLGKIFQSIAPSTTTTSPDTLNTANDKSSSASAMENQLDNLLSAESDAFTPGFLRHVEGECDRISSLSTISPESVKMLQILRLIQARVLEELGKGIGEGAIVLGQLLGYDDESERLAVLDAGLAVRGVDFAQELASLTQEALEGFKTVLDSEGGSNSGGGVDPDLIKSVEVIDERIRRFIGKMDFQ